MISILVPVYNWDVSVLINALYSQAVDLGVPFEIRVYEDGSDVAYTVKNEQLNSLENVVYVNNKHNVGRSSIRNRLAREAKFDHLIFMDCDSQVTSQSYLKQYFLQRDALAIYGGRSYEKSKPNRSNLLRWKYGVKRECLPAIQRQAKPYLSFLTNNFFIHKSVFDLVQFDEELVTYGYEDSFFAQELKAQGIAITHIDNPLVHLGLETSSQYISKTRDALANLHVMYVDGKLSESAVSLLHFYSKLKMFRNILASLYILVGRLLVSQLKSKNPSLVVFDAYRLLYFSYLESKRDS